MKICIDIDEVYPFYEISDSTFYGEEVEINEEFYKEYIEISRKFWSFHQKLEDLYNEERNKR